MTYNQLCQVLRAYATHSNNQLTAFLWLWMHVCMFGMELLGHEPGKQQLEPMIIAILLVSNLMMGRMLSGMLTLQFATPQARLAPGYAEPHLVVAGGIAGAAIAIEVALLSPWTGSGGLLAQVSLSVLAIGGGVWIAYSRSALGSFLGFAVFLAPAFAPTYAEAVMEALTDRPLLSLGIGCVGLSAMAALAVRLWTFREETPEYPRQMAVDRDLTSRADDCSRQRREAEAIARSWTRGWLRDVQFRLVLRGTTAASPWRRLLLRQLAQGFSSLSMTVTVFAFFFFMLLFQSWSGISGDGVNVFFLSFLPLLMTLVMQVVSWDRCWPHLARESLRPVGRKDFIGDLARSMAFDMTGAAAAHCALLVVWLKFLSPQGAPHGLLLPWLALTMAQYVVAYCLMLWLLTFRSFWGLTLGFAAACGIPTTLVIKALSFTEHNLWSPLGLATATIATALGSALLYQTAFRRWCRVELG